MGYPYGGYSSSPFDYFDLFGRSGTFIIITIISFVLAFVGGIVLYFTFLSPKNEGKFTGFVKWLYEFLGFKKMFVEALLKICYIISAAYVTLMGILSLFTNGGFLAFLIYAVFMNIILRVIYELILVTLIICRNTTEINKKLSLKADVKPAIDPSEE